MITFHISGLTLCCFHEDGLKLLMANAGANPANADIPHHLQTLVVPIGGWDPDPSKTTIRPLPSLVGRLPYPELETGHVGWDLSGFMVRIDAGTGRPSQTEVDISEYPVEAGTPPTRNWSDLHWVMSINRIDPRGRLKAAAMEVGDLTSTIVDITGGAVRGGTPTKTSDWRWVWYFGTSVVQAVTDTMDFVTTKVAPLTIQVSQRLNPGSVETVTVGSIVLRDGCEARLINEATFRDQDKRTNPLLGGMQYTTPQALDYPAFLELLDYMPSRRPVSIYRFTPQAFAGTFCVVLRMDV